MNITYHQGLTLDDWSKHDIFYQMANVGSEVFRTISWRNRNKEYSQKAFERGLELLDLTIADKKNTNRLKELLRTRETLIDYFLFDNIYNSSDKILEKYFLAFNLVARAKN